MCYNLQYVLHSLIHCVNVCLSAYILLAGKVSLNVEPPGAITYKPSLCEVKSNMNRHI